MCTAVHFTDASGNSYLARNLDWTFSYGEHVVITPTSYVPSSPFGAIKQIKYPVIGMGIVQPDDTGTKVPLYFDCGNTKGLAVAGLNFPGYGCYEKGPVDGKTNVTSYEFPLWVVANFETVSQVREALASVAIVDKLVNPKLPTSLLHWIVADANESIVVEYRSDGMHVFDDTPDVLTNQPGFGWHLENLRNYIGANSAFPADGVTWNKAKLTPFGSGSLMRGIPGDYYSTSRFVRIAYINANYPQKKTEAENVSRAFHSLTGVAMVDGCAAMADGAFEKTIYTGLFSGASNTYYWNTYDDPAIKSVALADYDTTGNSIIEVNE